MGNTSSSSSSSSSSTTSTSTSCTSSVKILSPFTKTLQIFTKPIKPSQIISQQNSNHFFITDSTLLEIGYRVNGLSPTEFLRPKREFYLILPIDMLFSVLTHEEFTLISEKASETLKNTHHHHQHHHHHNIHFKRIFPVCMFPSSSVNDDYDDNHNHYLNDYSDYSNDDVEIRENVQEKHGSWRPGLETIVES